MTTPAPQVTPPDTSDPDLFHWVCCDPNVALCGTDVTRHPMRSIDSDDDPCVVCADLVNTPCDGCGWDADDG
jgi:hypothetical protein